MGVTIRAAEASDAAAMSRIHALGWKQAYVGIVPQEYLDGLQHDFWVPAFEKWLRQGKVQAKLLYEDAVPAACIAYGPSREDSLPGWGEVVSLYVHPNHLRKGYGKKLLLAGLRELAEAGHPSAYLWVLEENKKARAFYKALGFTETADSCVCEFMKTTVVDIRYQLHLNRLPR